MAHAQTAPRQPVVVLTSYSEEIMSRFESAFEQAWPQYRLQVQWRMPFDALPHLQNPEQDAGVDVYWAASSRNFEALQKSGALERVAPQNEDDASGSEWRTPPLWGIGLTETVNGHSFFLHDGRARNLSEAIVWHGGEAQAARDRFVAMPPEDRAALLRFLQSL